MKLKDIAVGKTYYIKHTGFFANVLEILPPRQKENIHNSYTVCKCKYTLQQNDGFGFIRYFKPSDMEEIK